MRDGDTFVFGAGLYRVYWYNDRGRDSWWNAFRKNERLGTFRDLADAIKRCEEFEAEEQPCPNWPPDAYEEGKSPCYCDYCEEQINGQLATWEARMEA